MKKRIGIILLALLLTISLAACGEAETPAEERAFAAYLHYLDLIGHGDTGGAWDADFVMDLEMDISIMTIRMVSTGHAAAIITDEENMQMIMTMTTDMGMFGSMDMDMYMSVIDGAIEMRMTLDGFELPATELEPEMFEDATDSPIPLFDLADIVSVEVEEDGNYTSFHLMLDATAMSEFMEETMADQMGDMMDILGDDAGLSMSFGEDMSLTLVVYGSDDNPVSLIMAMEMRMGFEGEVFEEMDGEEMVIRMVIEYHYNAFGDAVVIESPPPAPDLDKTPELQTPVTLPATIDSDSGLVGSWDWLGLGVYYTFDADGTGARGITGLDRTYFDWTAEDGILRMTLTEGVGIIGFTEEWNYTIEGDELTIDSRQLPGLSWSYTRAS